MPGRTPSLIATLIALAVLSGPAAAQSLSPFGAWDEDEARQGSADRAPQSSYGGSFFGFGPGPGEPFPAIMEGGGRPQIAGRAPPIVPFYSNEKPGTILVDNSKRRLYLVLDNDEAYEYPISVGRDGFTWTGTETISRVADWPDWHPPVEMRQRDPRLPELMYGGIKNPLGVKALFLGNSLYRIHGTNDPKTIGYAASSGCFRMMNEHVVHLAALVNVGTVVKVMDHIPEPEKVASRAWQAKSSSLGGDRRGRDSDDAQYYDEESDVWIAR
jgi:L,D-transpeptidase catalytic domain